jgi:hypothetical protein
VRRTTLEPGAYGHMPQFVTDEATLGKIADLLG